MVHGGRILMAGTRDITLLQILWPKIHFFVSSGFGDEMEKEEFVSASRVLLV